MPAQSQQQQKLFGLALAFKRGEVPASEVSDEIKDIADRMSEKEIEDFASTKHKGLPKMKEQLRKIVREIMRERTISEMTEGKKRFRQQDGIGKAKYTISYHDGKQKHKDGSDFFGIQIFKNKKDLETFRNALLKKGFVEESVNEAKNDDKYVVIDFHEKGGGFVMTKPGSKKDAEDSARSIRKGSDISKREVLKVSDARKIRGLAGKNYLNEEPVNENAYKTWLKKNNMKDNRDNESLYYYLLKKYKSVSNFPKHYESVNEGYSTEEKRIVMMAVRKLAKYRNVPLDYAINDLLGAGKELERDIKKGKIKK